MSRNTRWLCAGLVAILMMLSSISQAASSLDAADPAVTAKINRLKQEVAAGPYTFSVGYSTAMEKNIDDLCGLREPLGSMDEGPVLRGADLSMQATSLPSSYDWRALGGTTPIKNQGNCGSCWAFATVAPLESQIKLQCGLTVDLSEQYLVSCNEAGMGCPGGWWAHAFHWTRVPAGEAEAGAVLESDAPYTATDSACSGPHEHPYKLTNWAFVAQYPNPTVQAIKQAIYTYGPIGASVYVGPLWQAYTGGIFNANEYGAVNHAIVLVGWVDDIGPDNGYWILRNSWGTSWGESGYMRIRYGSNGVGFAANYVEFACPGSTPSTPPTPVPSLPDLSGSYTKLATYYNGRQVAGTLKVVNTGTANTGSFKVIMYLSSDGVSKDTLIGTKTISSLKTGGYNNVSFSKTMPAGTTVYGQHVIGIIDADGQAVESSESNNTVTQVIPGTAPNTPTANASDLTGSYTRLVTYYGGRRVDGTLKVVNTGGANAGSFKVNMYISHDGVSKDTLISSKAISGLKANGYYSVTFSKTMASGTFSGQYVLGCIDAVEQVGESDENNNNISQIIP